MKEIVLGNGMVTLVDDADYDELMRYKWQAILSSSGASYVHRSCRVGGKSKSISMHRELMGFPAGMDVHHKNHNTLDNRRENLEVCTHKENLQRRRERKTKSGAKGIYLCKDGQWRMRFDLYFESQIAAREAYGRLLAYWDGTPTSPVGAD